MSRRNWLHHGHFHQQSLHLQDPILAQPAKFALMASALAATLGLIAERLLLPKPVGGEPKPVVGGAAPMILIRGYS